jgi:hypothetical protein
VVARAADARSSRGSRRYSGVVLDPERLLLVAEHEELVVVEDEQVLLARRAGHADRGRVAEIVVGERGHDLIDGVVGIPVVDAGGFDLLGDLGDLVLGEAARRGLEPAAVVVEQRQPGRVEREPGAEVGVERQLAGTAQ